MVASKQVYGLSTPFVSVFPDPITKTRSPLATDKNYPNGFVWIYKNGDVRTGYTFGGLDSNGDGVWILIGGGSTDVDSLSGDSGVADPTNGDINIAGGTNLTTVASSAAVTVNLDDAISINTSVTSPIYTSSSSTLNIKSDSDEDILVTIGSSAGASNFIVETSDSDERLSISAAGAIDITGSFNQIGGSFNIGQDNVSNSINIGGGNSTRAISIGNGSGDHTKSIGQAAAGTISLNTASDISIVSSQNDGNAIIINSSGGAGAIQLQSGTGGLLMGSGQTINITNVITGQSPYSILGSDFLIAIDSSGGVVTVTLPASPSIGKSYVVVDAEGLADSNNITIDGNGNQITKSGVLANTAIINTAFANMILYFNGTFWNGAYVA